MPSERAAILNDREGAIAVIHAALDAGITLLDTADIYAPSWKTMGHNERLVGEAFRSWSGSVKAKAKPFLILNEIAVESISVQDKVSALKWIPLICPDWAGSIPLTLVMNKEDGTYFETSFMDYEQLKKAVLPYIK